MTFFWNIKLNTLFKKSMDDAMSCASSFAEATRKEVNEIDRLFGALKGARQGTEEYNNAKNAIISKYGIYLKGLIDERGEITNLALAYERLTFAAQKSAQARAISAAKDKVQNTYLQAVDSLTEKLRAALEKAGMDIQSTTRLVTSISQSVALTGGISRQDWSEIQRYQIDNIGLLDAMFADTPMEILKELQQISGDYRQRSRKLEAMDNRYFRESKTDELDQLIESLSGQLRNSVQTSFNVALSIRDEETAKTVAAIIEDESRKGAKDMTLLSRRGAAGGATLPGAGIPASSQRAGSLPGTQPASSTSQTLVFQMQRAPYRNAGRYMQGTLTRKEAEQLLRELMFERSNRADGEQEGATPGARGMEQAGYTSSTAPVKNMGKAAAEAKRAAAKARQEFKDGLDAIRAEFERSQAAIIAGYATGQTNYLDYLDARKSNEMKFYDDSRAYYEEYFSKLGDAYIEDDKDYQALLRKREEVSTTYDRKIYSFRESQIKKSADFEVEQLKKAAKEAGEASIAEEIAMQEKILEIRVNSLQDRQALVPKGSEQWEKMQLELEQTVEAARVDKERRYLEKVREMHRQYDRLSAAERYRIELKTLEELLKANKASEEEIARWKKALQEKFAKEANLPGNGWGQELSREQQEAILLAKYKEKMRQIEDAVSAGFIDENEGELRKKTVKMEFLTELTSQLGQTGNEYADLFGNMAKTWLDAWEDMELGSKTALQKIGLAAQSTFAFVNSAVQMASQFAQANAQIEITAVEKRYDREKELAQGNTVLTKRLEADKQKKVAEIKNKAAESSFRMQIIQATAQMITGAMNAYTSTAAIPVIGPALAPAAAAVALAAGAANLALLSKQHEASKAQGYAEGGYTPDGRRDKVAGLVHAGEWVAPQELVRSPKAAPLIRMLEDARESGDMRQVERVSEIITGSARKPALDRMSSMAASPATSAPLSVDIMAPAALQRSVDVAHERESSSLLSMMREVERANAVGYISTGTVQAVSGISAADAVRSRGRDTATGRREGETTRRTAGTQHQQQPDADAAISRLNDVIDRLDRRLNEPIVAIASADGEYGFYNQLERYKRMLRNKDLK